MTLESVRRFVLDAEEDGWSAVATYMPYESIDKAVTLKRDGWVIQAIMRSETDFSLHIWGPDSLAVSPPDEYSWDTLQDGLVHCNHCGADGVTTTRLGFAGRVCPPCRSLLVDKVEYPGWYN